MERGSKIIRNTKSKQEAAVLQTNKQTNKKLYLNNCSLRKDDWNKHLMLLRQAGWAAGGRDGKEVCQTIRPCSWSSYWGAGRPYQGTPLPKSRID